MMICANFMSHILGKFLERESCLLVAGVSVLFTHAQYGLLFITNQVELFAHY